MCHLLKCTPAPSFQDASNSSNVSSESVVSLPSGEITVNLSVSQAPTSPNPQASVLSYPHSVSESLDEYSYVMNTDGVVRSVDWSVEEVMKIPRRTATTGHATSNNPPPSTAASPATPMPLTPSSKANLLLSPDASVPSRSGSVRSKSSPSVEIDADATPRPPMQSGPVTDHRTGGSQESQDRRSSNDWILEDLLRDGRLDIDAVNGALGLDLGFLDEPTPPSDSIFGNASYLSDTTASPSKEGMGWGRAALSGSTSFDMQIRKPGGLLCVIPEETEDYVDDGTSRPGSNRWSSVSREMSTRSRASGTQDDATASWLAT